MITLEAAIARIQQAPSDADFQALDPQLLAAGLSVEQLRAAYREAAQRQLAEADQLERRLPANDE